MSTVLYRVERAGSEELSAPVDYRTMVRRVKVLAPEEKEGSLRIVRCEYNLDLNAPPEPITRPQKRVWHDTILQFPEIGTAGTYVCKPLSQHRYGNATDWTAPAGMTDAELIEYLWVVFKWLRREGMQSEATNGEGGLPVSEVIFRDKITTRARDWTVRDYTGTFHATHVHDSAYPLIPTSTPCAG